MERGRSRETGKPLRRPCTHYSNSNRQRRRQQAGLRSDPPGHKHQPLQDCSVRRRCCLSCPHPPRLPPLLGSRHPLPHSAARTWAARRCKQAAFTSRAATLVCPDSPPCRSLPQTHQPRGPPRGLWSARCALLATMLLPRRHPVEFLAQYPHLHSQQRRVKQTMGGPEARVAPPRIYPTA
jgi:hypothetical protein